MAYLRWLAGWLWVSCGVAHGGGGALVSVSGFRGFSASVGKPLFWRGAGHWAIILWSLDTDPKS